MQFKSMAVHGFKSFADKTVLEFPSGITAIVGPNGSGKSNIMDALRWVFGEQRASELRGGDMEDVIFAGSTSRRPAGFAQVGLTLSDISPETASKWGTLSELTVTRKIYRTGEREYFVNNRRCRLKDIRELFMDTGVGARSISIIEQERVTKIVNSSPEELRAFLEDTAGIVRYKERRRDAEARLKQTADNMARIKDILIMLEGDIERLKSQVALVERYKEMRNLRTELEKRIIAARYATHNKERTKHLKQAEEIKLKSASFVEEHSLLTNRETSILRHQEESRAVLKKLRNEHDALSAVLTSTGEELARLESERGSAKSMRAQTETDISAAKGRLESLDIRIEEAFTEREEVKVQAESFKKQLEELTGTLAEERERLSTLEKPLKETSSLFYSLTSRLTELNNKISLKEAENANNTGRKTRLEKELGELGAERKKAMSRVGELSAGISTAETALTSLKTEEEQAKTALAIKEKEFLSRQKELAELKTNQRLAKEQITFIEKERTAKSDTKEAESYLARAGGTLYRKLYEGNEGYILYNDLYIFDDDKKYAALAAAKEAVFSFRFVFKSDLPRLHESGPLVRLSDGLYHHGVLYKKAGRDDTGFVLLELEERLTALTAEHELLRTQVSEHEKLVSQVNEELQALKPDAERLLGEIRQLEIKLSTLKANFKNAEDETTRLARNITVVERELATLTQAEETAAGELLAMHSEHTVITEKRKIAEQERARLEEEKRQINMRSEKLLTEKNNVSHELARYSERAEALSRDYDRTTAEKTEAEQILVTLNDRLACLVDTESEHWLKGYEVCQTKRDDATKASLILTDRISKEEETRTEEESQLIEIRGQIDKVNASLREVDRSMGAADEKAEQAQEAMRELSALMQETVGENLEEVWETYAKAGDLKKLETEKAELDNEIDNLGPLNMAAGAEYDEKTALLDSQTKQMTDIEASMANLSELISEIDESTVKMFEETFIAVQKNFSEVFTRFFGEGSAELKLTNPADMLTTGVELRVSPPGKRVSNNNLLSGGEKALAALTLLFALFLQKPTPFCFLDEVDAPLDDENAGRFINMLKLLATQTQFVVITHKHKTMAAADSLYGITMQEGGVSTVLSVELNG